MSDSKQLWTTTWHTILKDKLESVLQLVTASQKKLIKIVNQEKKREMHSLGIFQSVISNVEKGNAKLNKFVAQFVNETMLDLSGKKELIVSSELSN